MIHHMSLPESGFCISCECSVHTNVSIEGSLIMYLHWLDLISLPIALFFFTETQLSREMMTKCEMMLICLYVQGLSVTFLKTVLGLKLFNYQDSHLKKT